MIHSAILTLILFSVLQPQSVCADSQFFRNKNKSKHLVVFVHGLGGNASDTWTNLRSKDRFYWPKALSEDEQNGPFDTLSFEYRADCNNVLPHEAAEQLFFRVEGLLKENSYANVSFIGHSLGGIVIRDLLLAHSKDLKANLKIFLLGTPNLGNWLAIAKTLTCGGKYLNSLTEGRGSYLDGINDRWREVYEQRTSKKDFDFFAGYEVIPEITDIIVEKDSAVMFSQKIAPFDESHSGLAKPKDRYSATYKWFIRNSSGNPAQADNGISKGYEKRLIALFEKAREKLNKRDFQALVSSFHSESRETPLPADPEIAGLFLAAKMERTGNFREALETYLKLAAKKSDVSNYQAAAFELSAAYAAKNKVPAHEIFNGMNSVKIGESQKMILSHKIENQKREWNQYYDYYQNSIHSKAATGTR